MAVRITSRVSSGPLWIPLSSGGQLRLAPGQTSADQPDVEVQDNSSVASLISRGLIEVVPVGGARGGRGGAKSQSAEKASEEPATPDGKN